MTPRFRLSPFVFCLSALALPLISLAQTKPITWTAKSTTGAAITVPTSTPTLLLFLRPDQPQSQKALAAVAKLAPKDVQLVAIVSGDDAITAAPKLADKWTNPIVADEKYDASGKFRVRVWPTAVVLTKTGEEVGHIAGFPASFAKDLDATLAFSAGTIDKTELDKRLVATTIVADSPDQKAARHIEVAQRLATKGMKDAARAELAKAVDFKPTDPALQSALARTHLILGDAKSADAILAKLPATTADAKTLKGWTALLLEKHDDAKSLLEDAIKLNPQPAEPSYLLGLLYEKQGDPKKAASLYKSAFEHTDAGRSMGAGK